MRKSVLQDLGGFDPALRMCQDMHMWLRPALRNKLYPGSLDKPVAIRRVHGENRIIRDAEAHRDYHLMMWRSLLDWGTPAVLSEERRQELCRILIREQRALNQRRHGPLRRRLADARLLGEMTLKHRLGFANDAFERLFHDVVPFSYKLSGLYRRTRSLFR